MALTRKELLEGAGLAALGIVLVRGVRLPAAITAVGSLDSLLIEKYRTPLTIPPAMPRTGKITVRGGKNIEFYEIAVRQFEQQILPSGMPKTTVWSYGSLKAPGTVAQGGSFNYPALTIEAKWQKPVRVRWINDLRDGSGKPLSHLLAVDPTLHWANPPGGAVGRDSRPEFTRTPGPYTGPVPMVTHVHGAHASDESDGYAEAWFLPADATTGDFAGYAATGTWYDFFKAKFESAWGTDDWSRWNPGSAVFQYANDQDASTLWYHDHTLGMTRLNVYAGPAGFYLLRGGPRDAVVGRLPGPAPGLGDPPGVRYYEIPIAIQDRSFNEDGSLFYPDSRAFFEGLEREQLAIPFVGADACEGPSDVLPIWNPEFFGTTMVANGATWPYLEVEQRRYRFRLLNGCNSRFLILRIGDGTVPFWQIGAEGGFLSAPVKLNQLLMAPAERADVIVDFGDVPAGTRLTLVNLGPDEPFGGGVPGVDFVSADPQTTGQVLQFRVVPRVGGPDQSTPPDRLGLPARTPLPPHDRTRQLSLNEEESKTVFVTEDADGNVVLACKTGEAFGPTAALLGRVNEAGPVPEMWDDEVTQNPVVGATELWEILNFTVDAHPIHIHEVQFEVISRQNTATDVVRGPEPWETGLKDTVVAYPGEITRVKARFDLPGQYVWHCHIVEHEDNEMMRPLRVGDRQPGQPG